MKTRFWNISGQIIKFKWPVVLATTVLTVFFGLQLPKLSINSDILKSLPDSDKNARLLKTVSQNFGGHNIGIIILETENVYTTSVIEHISALTEGIAAIDGIGSVSSVTNIINIKGEDGGIEVGKLIDPYELPSSEESFETLREDIKGNKLYRNAIISEDETSAVVFFYLNQDAVVKEVANKVIETCNSLELPENLYYAGSPMLVSYISDLMRNDLVTLLPISMLVIALVLFLSFKSLCGVVLPLLSAVIATIWTLGSMSLLGYNMTMISNNIPIILLAVGSAYAIHVINKVRLDRSDDFKEGLQSSLSAVFIPVILAGITTAVGFVSFIFGAYLDMIVEFGIFSSLGTLYACLLALTFVPAIIAIAGSRAIKSRDPLSRKDGFIEKAIHQMADLVVRKPKQILSFWAILILSGLAGIFFIERSVNIQDYFKPGNPARKAEQIMMDKFGGTKPVFMLFEGDILNPVVLKAMMDASAYMEGSPDINSTLSVAHLVAELNYAITGNRAIPEDPEQIQQLWFLLDGNETLQRLIDPDLTQAIIISKFKSPDNASKKAFASYMDAYISSHPLPDVTIEITGMPFVDVVMDKSLINSQIGSILIALIFVIIVIGVVLKSFKYGLLATIPIAASIIILFGLMGLTGISLNIGTVLVASVALGIGIDYSIHIITQFNKKRNDQTDPGTAATESIRTTGKAIIINFLAVSSGFLVLVFSEMVPLIYFGVLIAVSMISSGLGALTLLPVILISSKKTHD